MSGKAKISSETGQGLELEASEGNWGLHQRVKNV